MQAQADRIAGAVCRDHWRAKYGERYGAKVRECVAADYAVTSRTVGNWMLTGPGERLPLVLVVEGPELMSRLGAALAGLRCAGEA